MKTWKTHYTQIIPKSGISEDFGGSEVAKQAFDQGICGGPEGDRTLDLCIANAALSQLSYGPFLTYIKTQTAS